MHPLLAAIATINLLVISVFNILHYLLLANKKQCAFPVMTWVSAGAIVTTISPRNYPSAILWHPVVFVLTYTVTRLLPSSLQKTRGNPLGPGYVKFVEFVVVLVFWKVFRYEWPQYHILDETDKLKTNARQIITGMLVLCGCVNFVLWLWTKYQVRTSQTPLKGSHHQGMERLAGGDNNSKPSLFECIQLAGWAIVNATCEELTARGFWQYEFQFLLLRLFQQDHRKLEFLYNNLQFSTNILQAFSFGCWHFYGIPNGWVGVILSLVYGIILGFLADCLLLPIVAHSVADYFIFSYVVRQEKKD